MKLYKSSLTGVTAGYPNAVYTPEDIKDPGEYTMQETLPSIESPYLYLLKLLPARFPVPVVTVNGSPRTVVPYSPSASPTVGQVAISFDLPLIEFAAADAAATNFQVDYTGLGTVPVAQILNQMQVEIAATQTATNSKADLVGGKVPTSQLPALALTDVNTVASEAAQLALVAEEGDVAIRTDINKTFVHNGGTAGTMADWSELATPTDAVTSVNGQTGVVNLTAADVGAQAADSDLTAVAGLSSTGIIARTGTGTAAVRTVTGTGSNITVTNGNSVSGNPTIDVGSNISKLDSENLFTTSGRQVYTRNGNSDYLGSTAINNSYFFTLGRGEYGVGTYRLIGFGYTNTTVDCPPAFIGYREVSDSGQTAGELVFGTRASTTNTDATVRARIKNNGDVELFHGLQVGSGTLITKVLSATASLDFPSIAANATASLTMTVSGAAAGDVVELGAPSTIETGLIWSGYVSAADTVTIRVHNGTAGAIDPATATWRAKVTKF